MGSEKRKAQKSVAAVLSEGGVGLLPVTCQRAADVGGGDDQDGAARVDHRNLHRGAQLLEHRHTPLTHGQQEAQTSLRNKSTCIFPPSH